MGRNLTAPLLVLVMAACAAWTGDGKRPTTYTDPVFHFRVKRPDSRNWTFHPPTKAHGNLRLQVDHLIGGKKDFIRFLFHAWNVKTMHKTERGLLEEWKGKLEAQFSEIREKKLKAKDTFGRYRSTSFSVAGRLAKGRGEIRYMKVHVFKQRNTVYAVLLLYEPGMDEKYAEDIRTVEKSLRAP